MQFTQYKMQNLRWTSVRERDAWARAGFETESADLETRSARKEGWSGRNCKLHKLTQELHPGPGDFASFEAGLEAWRVLWQELIWSIFR